jgi:ubiquinone biosynthesis protein COQ4
MATQNETHRIRFMDAVRGLRAIMRNPDDTEKVGEIFEAFGGAGEAHIMARMQRRPDGLQILSRPVGLTEVLGDREALARLPEGSLGRIYLDYMIQEQLTTEGLVAIGGAIETDAEGTAGVEAVLRERQFAMHDLFHVVTGFGRDLVGEAALLAFTFAQTRSPALGFVVVVTYLLTLLRLPDAMMRALMPNPPPGFEDHDSIVALRRAIREAYRCGKEAGWLVGADWEALLERPMGEVRCLFGITPAEYRAVRSVDAPAQPVAA